MIDGQTRICSMSEHTGLKYVMERRTRLTHTGAQKIIDIVALLKSQSYLRNTALLPFLSVRKFDAPNEAPTRHLVNPFRSVGPVVLDEKTRQTKIPAICIRSEQKLLRLCRHPQDT